jgi:hypothetical protein
MDEHITKRLERICVALETMVAGGQGLTPDTPHVDVASIRESPLVPVVEKIAKALNLIAENQEKMTAVLQDVLEIASSPPRLIEVERPGGSTTIPIL